MERWAANTLRTLGIIMTAGFVLVTSLILLLLSMCAAQNFGGGPSHADQAVPFILAALVVLLAGVWFIIWLARGIVRSHKIPEPGAERLPPASPVDTAPAQRGIPMPAPPQPQFSAPLHPALLDHPAKPAAVTEPGPSVPLHLSPLGRKAIDRLVLALGAQIFLSAVAWIFNQLHFWSARLTPRATGRSLCSHLSSSFMSPTQSSCISCSRSPTAAPLPMPSPSLPL